MNDKTQKRFLRRNEVVAKTTLSPSTIYALIRRGAFPPSRRISGQAVAWLESEVDEWMDSRPEADPADWHSQPLAAARQAKIRAVK